MLAAQLDERRTAPGTLYNLACAEARAGLGEAAIAQLPGRRARLPLRATTPRRRRLRVVARRRTLPAHGGMSERGFEVTRLEELESLPGPGTLAGRRCGGRSASPRSASTPTRATEPGRTSSRSTPRRRSGTRRCTSCSRGRATFTLGDEEIDAPAGHGRLHPRPRRAARRERDGAGHDRARGRGRGRRGTTSRRGSTRSPPTAYLQGGQPSMASPCCTRASRRRAATIRPLLYDLACFESLERPPRGGDRAPAAARSISTPKYRTYAAGDTDLDAIRDDRASRASRSAVAGQAAAPAASARNAGHRDRAPAARRAARRRAPRPRASRRGAGGRPRARTPCAPARRRTGTSSSARARPAITSPGDRAHRDVGDERAPVRARDRDRERVRAGQRRPAGRVREPRPARSR